VMHHRLPLAMCEGGVGGREACTLGMGGTREESECGSARGRREWLWQLL